MSNIHNDIKIGSAESDTNTKDVNALPLSKWYTNVSTLMHIITWAIVGIFGFFVDKNIKEIRVGMDENEMIKNTVTDLVSDKSTIKTDFALLILERYIKKSNDGVLKPYDKDFIVGFAYSIYKERISNIYKDSADKLANLVIPIDILMKYDSAKLVSLITIQTEQKKSVNVNVESLKSDEGNIKPLFTYDTTKYNVSAISLSGIKRAYVQYANSDLKDSAEKANRHLKQSNFTTANIDAVVGNYDNTIVYFHLSDQDLVNQIKNTDIFKDYKLIYSSKYSNSVPKGQIEIWIGKK